MPATNVKSAKRCKSAGSATQTSSSESAMNRPRSDKGGSAARQKRSKAE